MSRSIYGLNKFLLLVLEREYCLINFFHTYQNEKCMLRIQQQWLIERERDQTNSPCRNKALQIDYYLIMKFISLLSN